MSQPQTPRLSHYSVGFFLSKRAEGITQNTVDDYKKYFAHFARWGADRIDFTPTELKAFFAWLREQPNGHGANLSAKTVYNAWVALRSLYRWYAEETGTANPMLGIKAPKTTEPVILPLTEGEVKAILKAAEYTRTAQRDGQRAFVTRRPTAVRDKALVLTLLDTGLRASELCDLKVGDFDLATGKVLVKSGKGGKGRIVYAGKIARKALWRYLSGREVGPSEPLFATRDERPLDRNRLQHLLANLGERAGVPGVHPHRLRHSFATEFLRNGGNLLGLQRLLGHTSLQMVQRYAQIMDADLAKAHESGSPADRWRL